MANSISDFAKYLNHQAYIDVSNRLKLLALSVFKWDGLPPTCNARFLEKTLFTDGKAIFCMHKENDGIINLRCNPVSPLTIYDEYSQYQAYSNGYSENYDIKDCVVVFNNFLSLATFPTLDIYAHKISEIDRAIDVNINAQKTPLLIKCDEKQKITLLNLYKQYDGNTPVIYGAPSLTLDDNFKVITTAAPYLAKSLYEMRAQYWNDALNFLGINSNPSPDKKERLLIDEVNSNNEVIDFSADSFLATRQEAAEKLNKLFGLSVTVTKREQSEITESIGGE